MKDVGYTDFSLGLPGNLVPVAKGDYCAEGNPPTRFGEPQRDDGSTVSNTTQMAGRPGVDVLHHQGVLSTGPGEGTRGESFIPCWPAMPQDNSRALVKTACRGTGTTGRAVATATNVLSVKTKALMAVLGTTENTGQ